MGARVGEIKKDGQMWFVLPPKTLKRNQDDQLEGIMSPFWVVKECEDGQLMEKWVTYEGIQIKMLVNATGAKA